MCNTSVLVRSLISPGHGRICVFVACIDVTAQLMFEQGIPMDDISVMKDVYSQVAEIFGMNVGAVSKNAERMTKRCWEVSSPESLEQIVGRSLKKVSSVPAPKTILQYLAVYSYLETPFFKAIDDHPEILF